MFKQIDESQFLIKTLARLSTWLARQRGLPIIAGILLFLTGGVLEFVNLALDNTFIHVLEIIFHNVGVVLALVGILLADPLGQ